MSSDSEDDALLVKVCQLVTTNMDSVILRYPKLWGLNDLPERSTLNMIGSQTQKNTTKEVDEDPKCAIASLDDITSDDFRCQFLMSRLCFAELMKKITGISVISDLKKKLLFTIWLLRTQDSYESVVSRFDFTKATANLALNEVLDVILTLFSEYVKMSAESEFQEISQAFKAKTGGFIPGIIGVIDACHIQIKQPAEDSEDYRNEEMTYSIILQAVCDHRNIFTDVYVGSPGSMSYSEVFKDSNLYKQLTKMIPGEYHLVGDSDYPLLKNVVTPFRETDELSEEKARFNDILKLAAMTIEKTFQMLHWRFKKLSFLDVTDVDLANKMVCSCITLHNHIQLFDTNENDDQLDENFCFRKEKVFEGLAGSLKKQERSKAGYFKRNYLMSLCD